MAAHGSRPAPQGRREVFEGRVSTSRILRMRAASGARILRNAVIINSRPDRPRGSRQASFVLQAFVVSAFLLPADTVIRVIGGQGYVSSLIAMALFLAWLLTAVFRFHDPLRNRHPVRGVLGLLWVSSLLAYAAMPFYGPTEVQRLSAGRWLMLLVAMSGVILVAAEHLRSAEDITRVVRIAVWGAAVSGVVAVLQFGAGWDLKPILRLALPGFTYQDGYSGFQGRDALIRVSGTAFHPIELGVVAGMMLPLALWLAFYDVRRSALRRWIPVALIGMCVPMSVSRSAVLTVAISLSVFTVCMPAAQRAWLVALAPVGVVAVFATTPGYLRTIFASFTSAASDPSILNRTDNYPRVLAMVEAAPWLGRGGGTYLAPDATKILDNQYLSTAITLGLLGLLTLTLFFVVPIVATVLTRRRSRSAPLRALCAALIAGTLGAAVGSYMFDSFSFPQFTSIYALLAGLCGACWLYVRRKPADDWPDPTRDPVRGAGS